MHPLNQSHEFPFVRLPLCVVLCSNGCFKLSQVLHNGEEEDNVEGGEVEDGKGEEDVEGGEEEGGEEEDDVEAPFEYEIVTKTTITGKKTHVIYVGDNKYLSRGIKKNGRAFFYCNFVSVHHFI